MALQSRNIPSLPETSEDFFTFIYEDEQYMVNLSFLASNYTCIYGKGTCGFRVGVNEPTYRTDIGGCCFGGVDVFTEEREHMEEMASQLTPELVNPATYERIKDGKGFKHTYDAEGNITASHTRIWDGGCVFANRANEGDKRGCSFHHLAESKGLEHVDAMPNICWAHPIVFSELDVDDDPDVMSGVIHVISNASYETWNFEVTEATGSADDLIQAVCTESPDTYIGDRPVYKSYSRELIELLGQECYDMLVVEIERRAKPVPTRGQVRNGGRPLLPLLIGNSKEKYAW